jgi:hypothetical protein
MSHSRRVLRVLGLVGGGLLLVACEADADRYDPESPWTEGAIGTWQAGLNVGQAGGCSTAIVRGLAGQLIDEINCLRPNTLVQFSRGDINEGESVWPFLQAPAVADLHAALDQRGRAMSMNSALRTLPQQYLLYKWYQDGQCGISLAARPGRSPHESGKAIDIEDHGGWQNALENHSWSWHGNDDAVHFDYVGGGTVDLSGLSVRAFQRLWNRNHPDDLIAEDGQYGPQTEGKLRASPVDGFDIGGCEPDPPPPPPPPPDPDAAPPPPPPPDPDAATPPPPDPDAGAPPPGPDMALKDAIVPGRDFAEPPPKPEPADAANPSEPPPDDDPFGGQPSDPGAGGGLSGSGGALGSAPPVRLTSASPGVRSLHYDGGCRQTPGSLGALWGLVLLGALRRRRRASRPLDKA